MSQLVDNAAWQAKINPLVRALFITPSVTSRMLRVLLRRGEMTQATFMNEYHRRCAREHPSRSSFDNNFGRFLVSYMTGTPSIPAVRRVLEARVSAYVVPFMTHVYDPDHPLRVMKRWRIPGKGNQNMLVWVGPSCEELLAKMTIDELDHAYELLEREMTNQRATDVDGETTWWLAQVRAEQARRGGKVHNPNRARPATGATPNPYEVHSATGLEGMFADRDDADALADELKKAGARGVEVRSPSLKLRPTRYASSPPMHHAPRGRPPGVPNVGNPRKNPEIGDVRVRGRILRGTSDLEVTFQAAADAFEEGRDDDVIARIYEQVPYYVQSIVFKGMAKALWVTAYADWIDNRIEQFQAEMTQADQQDELEALMELRPGPGENWEDAVPERPVWADWAAEDLACLFERANNASTGDATCMLECLYHRAVEADAKTAKAPFVPDEKYAELFGHYLAMQAMGHGVSWFDDHPEFPIRFPDFEVHSPDGEDLSWSPHVVKRGMPKKFAPSAPDPEDEPEDEDDGYPDGDSLGGARGLGVKNPAGSGDGSMWRVWIGTSPNSYTDVMARDGRDAMVRGAPVFKAEHHGEVVEINARQFGQKVRSTKLVRIQRDGRIVFT